MKRVRAKWTMRFMAGTKLLAKVGDKLGQGETLGEEVTEETIKVDMSEKLSGLSAKKLAELNLKKGKKIAEGEVLAITDGWWGKKILSPVEGVLINIDEFFNLEVTTGKKRKRKIVSPVEGKVVKMEKDNLTIEFGATEVEGEGKEPGKVWADGLIIAEDIKEKRINCFGKVAVVAADDPTLIKKIEAIGGVGLVTKDARINSCLPTLIIDETEFEKLKGLRAEEKRLLLNTIGGRLLLVE